jgi:SAM-dependent methyltransferase
MDLLPSNKLEQSCIVANNRMNRERVALGSNGYESEIGFDPIAFLAERYESNNQVAWLDLCCGRGKALIEAGTHFAKIGFNANSIFMGVDLVDMFDPIPDELDFVQLESASLSHWTTSLQFDLITCVHGLHYVGDKLGLVSRTRNWLKPTGEFHASLDLQNLKTLPSEQPLNFASLLKEHEFRFDHQSHLLSFANSSSSSHISQSELPVSFVGADDTAGPNYTRQPAVNSYYDQAQK